MDSYLELVILNIKSTAFQTAKFVQDFDTSCRGVWQTAQREQFPQDCSFKHEQPKFTSSQGYLHFTPAGWKLEASHDCSQIG